MRILVTGSRSWTDYPTMRNALLEIIVTADEPVTIVHGGARGADEMAAVIGRKYGCQVEEHRAHWRVEGVYNARAGLARNEEMVRLGADICLAFWKAGSTGTGHCIAKAREAGIAVVIFN